MTAVLLWFRSTWAGRALSAVLTAIVVLLGVFTAGKRKGAQNARQKARERDEKRAADIRRRTAPDELHDDGDGYRD